MAAAASLFSSPADDASSRKYFDPDSVVTNVPPIASLVIGDVDTNSPSSNDGEPNILPLIPPSRSCLQSDMTGTPRGALANFFGADFADDFG